MYSERIRQLLDDLRKETLGKADDATQRYIQDLDIDINQLLLAEPEVPEKELAEEMIQQARDMEAKFAAEHPVAQRLMQEIIYILGQIGI